MSDITEQARKLYARSEGTRKAWEPPKGNRTPFVQALVDAGFLKRVKMRCMFEALGEVGVAWTEAAHAAFGVKQ